MQKTPIFLTRSALLTGLRALAIILVISFILEGLARTESAKDLMPDPGTGSQHPQFDEKLARLNARLDAGDPLNCLIVGDSGANRNLNPDVLRESYLTETGESLNCFNFALGGMSAKELDVLINLVLDFYTPDVLIYGVTPGQFGRQLSNLVGDSAWAKYRQGTFSVEGFLSNESAAFAYYLGGIRWFLGDPRADQEAGSHALTPYGHDASTLKLDLSREQAAAIEARSDEVAVIQDKQVKALDHILALQEKGIAVRLVEMPFHEINFRLADGELQRRFQEEFLAMIRDHASDANVPFIEVPDDMNIPDEQWKDSTHLNTWGADIFSAWLATELAQEPF
jgi:hypothetical protein